MAEKPQWLSDNPGLAEAQLQFRRAGRDFITLSSGSEDQRRKQRANFNQQFEQLSTDPDLTIEDKIAKFSELRKEILAQIAGESFQDTFTTVPWNIKGTKRPRYAPTDKLAVIRFTPKIEAALRYDDNSLDEYYKKSKAEGRLFNKYLFGDDYHEQNPSSPSITAICLRWDGYNRLGEDQFAPSKPSSAILIAKIGTGAHYQLERTLRRVDKNLLKPELGFMIDEPEMSGRMDYVYTNPHTNQVQLIEIKTVGNFVYQQVKREKLPDYLQKERGLYPVNKTEHRRQVLQYLWVLEKRGMDVLAANVIYLNRDNGKLKEALLLWDEVAKYEAEDYVRQIKEAQTHTDTYFEPPLPTIVEESKKFYCGVVCPYRGKCEYATSYFVKAMKRRDIPQSVRILAKKKNQERLAKISHAEAIQIPLELESG